MSVGFLQPTSFCHMVHDRIKTPVQFNFETLGLRKFKVAQLRRSLQIISIEAGRSEYGVDRP